MLDVSRGYKNKSIERERDGVREEGDGHAPVVVLEEAVMSPVVHLAKCALTGEHQWTLS